MLCRSWYCGATAFWGQGLSTNTDKKISRLAARTFLRSSLPDPLLSLCGDQQTLFQHRSTRSMTTFWTWLARDPAGCNFFVSCALFPALTVVQLEYSHDICVTISDWCFSAAVFVWSIIGKIRSLPSWPGIPKTSLWLWPSVMWRGLQIRIDQIRATLHWRRIRGTAVGYWAIVICECGPCAVHVDTQVLRILWLSTAAHKS